jgi:hypothetical protein
MYRLAHRRDGGRTPEKAMQDQGTNEPNSVLSRRGYLRASAVGAGLALGVLASGPAAAEPPEFAGRIYADGELWATKGVADLPLPNDNNAQSYDKLFPTPDTDLIPISEAAPGNPNYNGGRWAVHPLTWHVEPEQLESYAQVQAYAMAGKLSYSDAPVDAFECPLVRLEK